MKLVMIICLLVLALATASLASSVWDTEYTCPSCNTEFTAKHQVAYTLMSEWTQLDGKPTGAAVVPDILPLCPHCHFPQVQQEFDEELISQLREYVESEEYQSLAEDNSSHFLLAKIMERFGSPPDAVGHQYLEASWQMDGTEHPYYRYPDRPDKYREYAALAIRYFSAEAVDWYAHYNLICADLERKCGQFDQAKERLYELDTLPLNADRFQVLAFELQLIEAGDTDPHFLAEAKDDTLPWSQPDSTAVEQP